MLSLKIISAGNLPSGTLYAKIFPQNFGQRSEKYNATTNKIRRTTNPEWNHEILIPFYCFQSIIIEFYNKKELIGTSEIPLTISIFCNSQPQSIDIKSTKINSAYCKFSLTMTNFSPPPKSESFPVNVYIYLTYSPPLQLNQNVQLFVKAVSQDDQIINASELPLVQTDKDSARLGPSGLTQVYYFQDHKPPKGFTEKYLFYIKSSNYSGNVTLNFSVFDYYITKGDKFYQLDKKSTVSVKCNQNQSLVSFAVFPSMHSIFDYGLHNLTPINPPVDLNVQNVQHKSQEELNAEKRIIDYMSRNFCTIKSDNAHKEIVANSISRSRQNKLVVGNRYSITKAFKNCEINEMPSKIVISFCGTFPFLLDYKILTSFDAADKLGSYYFGPNEFDPQMTIYDLKRSFIDEFKNDQRALCFNIKKSDPSIKYYAFFISSNLKMTKNEANLNKGEMFINSICRISDFETRKEIMSFDIQSQKHPAAVLTFLLVNINNDWEIWPCMKYFIPQNPFIPSPIKYNDIPNFFENFMRNEIQKMFKF